MLTIQKLCQKLDQLEGIKFRKSNPLNHRKWQRCLLFTITFCRYLAPHPSNIKSFLFFISQIWTNSVNCLRYVPQLNIHIHIHILWQHQTSWLITMTTQPLISYFTFKKTKSIQINQDNPSTNSIVMLNQQTSIISTYKQKQNHTTCKKVREKFTFYISKIIIKIQINIKINLNFLSYISITVFCCGGEFLLYNPIINCNFTTLEWRLNF